MSRYSVRFMGEYHPYTFQKFDDGMYNFRLNNILIGQLFKIGKSWSCVPWYNAERYKGLSPMDGFRTRLDAVSCLLRMTEITDR